MLCYAVRKKHEGESEVSQVSSPHTPPPPPPSLPLHQLDLTLSTMLWFVDWMNKQSSSDSVVVTAERLQRLLPRRLTALLHLSKVMAFVHTPPSLLRPLW